MQKGQTILQNGLDEKITQLVLISTQATEAWNLGPTATDSEDDFQAEENQRIIGFWGAQTREAITQIGFLIADDACVEKYGVEKEIDDNVVDEN